MTTDLPSVRTYLSQDDYDTLSECARVTGLSRSALVRSLLSEAIPMFAMVVDAHQRASAVEKLPAEALRRVVEDLQEASRLVDAGRAKAESGLRAVGPPPSNRGVRR